MPKIGFRHSEESKKKMSDSLKGRASPNKGKKFPQLIGNQHAVGYKHTDEAKLSISITHSNEKHWGWKGNGASYSAIHKWLKKNYGPAYKCENKTCLGKSNIFQYALKHNYKYIHDRKSYVMLCVSCHKYYDSRLNKLNVRL